MTLPKVSKTQVVIPKTGKALTTSLADDTDLALTAYGSVFELVIEAASPSTLVDVLAGAGPKCSSAPSQIRVVYESHAAATSFYVSRDHIVSPSTTNDTGDLGQNIYASRGGGNASFGKLIYQIIYTTPGSYTFTPRLSSSSGTPTLYHRKATLTVVSTA